MLSTMKDMLSGGKWVLWSLALFLGLLAAGMGFAGCDLWQVATPLLGCAALTGMAVRQSDDEDD